MKQMFENTIDCNFQLLNKLLKLFFIRNKNKAQLAGRRSQNSEFSLQECKGPPCPGGRSLTFSFISKTTKIFSTEFIDRLVKNSARNDAEKLTVPHFSPTFISQDGDTAVCPLIMRLVTQSVTQCFLYKKLKCNSSEEIYIFHLFY